MRLPVIVTTVPLFPSEGLTPVMTPGGANDYDAGTGMPFVILLFLLILSIRYDALGSKTFEWNSVAFTRLGNQNLD